MLSSPRKDRSPHAYRVNEIRNLISGGRMIEFVKVRRDVNVASHSLAYMGRSQHRTACWLRSTPEDIASVVNADCNLIP